MLKIVADLIREAPPEAKIFLAAAFVCFYAFFTVVIINAFKPDEISPLEEKE